MKFSVFLLLLLQNIDLIYSQYNPCFQSQSISLEQKDYFKKQIDGAYQFEAKKNTLKGIIENNCLSISDVLEFLPSVYSNDFKKQIIEGSYARVVDPQNFYLFYHDFTYSVSTWKDISKFVTENFYQTYLIPPSKEDKENHLKIIKKLSYDTETRELMVMLITQHHSYEVSDLKLILDNEFKYNPEAKFRLAKHCYKNIYDKNNYYLIINSFNDSKKVEELKKYIDEINLLETKNINIITEKKEELIEDIGCDTLLESEKKIIISSLQNVSSQTKRIDLLKEFTQNKCFYARQLNDYLNLIESDIDRFQFIQSIKDRVIDKEKLLELNFLQEKNEQKINNENIQYNERYSCKPLTNEEVRVIKIILSRETSNLKNELYLRCYNRCFTTQQYMDIVAVLPSYEDRLYSLKKLYNNILDFENYENAREILVNYILIAEFDEFLKDKKQNERLFLNNEKESFSDCNTILSIVEVFEIRRDMASKSLDSEKFKEAIKYIDVKCFGSSNVVSQISSGFISDLTRLEFLKLAFEKTKSNENYIEIGSQFKSQEYKKEFENFTKQ